MDVFRHSPFSCGRGCRAAVDLLVVCVGVVGFRVYLFVFSFRTHTAFRKYKAFLTLIVMRQGRGSDVAETVFCL